MPSKLVKFNAKSDAVEKKKGKNFSTDYWFCRFGEHFNWKANKQYLEINDIFYSSDEAIKNICVLWI